MQDPETSADAINRPAAYRSTSDQTTSDQAAPYQPPLSVSLPPLLGTGLNGGKDDVAFRHLIDGLFVAGDRLERIRAAFGQTIGVTGPQYSMLMAIARLQEARPTEARLQEARPTEAPPTEAPLQEAVTPGAGPSYRGQGVRGGLGVRALAEHLHVAAPFVTTEVHKLVAAGLVDKARDPGDRRAVCLRLTAAGEAAIDALGPLVAATNDQLFAGVDAAEFAVIQRFVQRFVGNSAMAITAMRTVAGTGTDAARHRSDAAPSGERETSSC